MVDEDYAAYIQEQQSNNDILDIALSEQEYEEMREREYTAMMEEMASAYEDFEDGGW